MAVAGATKRDWLHFQHVLGLGADLLPVVPDKTATPSPLSKVKAFGKIPSAYNGRGEAHGIAQWQSREITEDEVDMWSEDRRLSLCVRAKAVRAIDVDITNPELAGEVLDVIQSNCPYLVARRTRANSSKFLLPVLLDGAYAKRIIDCGSDGRIEFLADGQQWLLAGGHESGAMYEWTGGLPTELYQADPTEFEALWARLVERFAVQKVNSAPKSSLFTNSEDDSLRTEISDIELGDLNEALKYKPLLVAAADNDTWSEIGYALLSLGGVGARLFGDFSIAAPNYTQGAHVEWWLTHNGQTPRSDFRHIFTIARQLGWRGTAAPTDFALVEPRAEVLIDPELVEDLAGPPPVNLYPTTDLANARRLHDKFAGKTIIYGRGCFHEWAGSHWERKETAGKRVALQLSTIVHDEAEELKPKLEALIEAASPDLLTDFAALQVVQRRNRAGHAIFKKIGRTDLWRTYATIEDLEVWAKQCESGVVQATAAALLKTVMEVL